MTTCLNGLVLRSAFSTVISFIIFTLYVVGLTAPSEKESSTSCINSMLISHQKRRMNREVGNHT